MMVPAKDSIDRWIEDHAWAEFPQLDLEVEGIVNRIGVLSKYVKRSFDETASEFGINKGELDILKMLRLKDSAGAASPSHLADRLRLSSGAMTNRLDRLETQGLIERRADPNDRRGVIVKLTDKGDEIFRSAIERQIEKEKDLVAPLSSNEREKLSHLLRKLIAEIESSPLFPWKS
jgi:DNA-binding MarR family transcriptional regulator